jgi:hypothetical protein
MGDRFDGFDPRDFALAITSKTPKYGEKQCYKELSVATNDKEALTIVADTYKKWLGEEPFTYTAWNDERVTTDWVGALQMIWDCAYMRRWEGDRPNVSEILKKMGVIT